ncbi:MAG: acetyl-CoA carboxylase biotin carboxyl carrier protein subunit, partial [Planctomycetaceae bacterium]|nr:acetyl-CoA carboxylase biotin carboxyl carrier protein subunit [Planctomycetaceae bacterium]
LRASNGDGGGAAAVATAAAHDITAQMPGKVHKILLHPGSAVAEGQAILVLEAMKMEVPVNATVAGTIASIDVTVGEQITTGQKLASIG